MRGEDNRPARGKAGGTAFRAAVFDMDGLLIDSEPFWREAERRVFAGVGLVLTDEDCTRTMGLRIDEAVGYWFARAPWRDPSPHVVAERIVEAVIALVRSEGRAMPGTLHALSLCEGHGLRLALASSSAPEIIDAVLNRLGVRARFEVVHSAASEKQGKPHPDVYRTTCNRLGLPPEECVAFEDSLNGVRAARAAGMHCIAVPGLGIPGGEAIAALADVVLPSLGALSAGHLEMPVRSPSSSRPRRDASGER